MGLFKPCDKCRYTGWLFIPHPVTKELQSHPCECQLKYREIAMWKRALINAEIPPSFWDATLEGFSQREGGYPERSKNESSLQALTQYPLDPNRSAVLWIWGKDPYAGHTSLAVITAKELLKRGFQVKFLEMQDLLDAFTDFENKQEYFTKLQHHQFFILNDAFDTKRSYAKGEYTQIHLFSWLNKMLSYDRNLICTAKLDVSNIDGMYEQSKQLLVPRALSLQFAGSFARPARTVISKISY